MANRSHSTVRERQAPSFAVRMVPIGDVVPYVRNPRKNTAAVAKVAGSLREFGGSGTTLLAAEATGRRCCAIELSPGYCDVIVRRWEDATGLKAVRP